MSAAESTQNFHDVRQAGLLLAAQVMPIYEYAEKIDPFAVVICDRGARPIGVALEAIQEVRRGLPSVENRWYYRRISKKLPLSVLVEHLRDPLETLGAIETDKPLMVVDDYVSPGAGTAHLFRHACRELQVGFSTNWVTLSGKGTSFNAMPLAGAAPSATWRDNTDVLGCDYDGRKLLLKPTELSEMFYSAIHEGVSRLLGSPARDEVHWFTGGMIRPLDRKSV